MQMNLHDLSHQQNCIVATHGTLGKAKKENPTAMMILLVILGSFVLGAIPLFYGFTLPSSSPQAPTVPHEGTLWHPVSQ